MLSEFRRRLSQRVNLSAAEILDELGEFAKDWLNSVNRRSSPLYHEYIEGMLADYTEVCEVWRGQGYSAAKILFYSLPKWWDITLGIFHLTAARLMRGISLFFYGTEQILVLDDTADSTILNWPLNLRPLLGLLHRVTGDVAKKSDKVTIKLNPSAQIIAWEEDAESLFGFTADQMLGQSALNTFVPAVETGGRILADLIQGICSSPQNYTLNVNENQDCDGNRIWIFWVNVPCYDDAKHLIEVSCVGVRIEDPEIMHILIKFGKWWKGKER